MVDYDRALTKEHDYFFTKNTEQKEKAIKMRFSFGSLDFDYNRFKNRSCQ